MLAAPFVFLLGYAAVLLVIGSNAHAGVLSIRFWIAALLYPAPILHALQFRARAKKMVADGSLPQIDLVVLDHGLIFCVGSAYFCLTLIFLNALSR